MDETDKQRLDEVEAIVDVRSQQYKIDLLTQGRGGKLVLNKILILSI